MRALAESPDGRWPDAGAFRDAFEAAALAATRQRRRAAIGVPLTVIGASVAVVVALAFGETVRAWLHARVCRVARLSDCAPPLRLADLAILPFVAPEGRDDPHNLAVQVARHLEGTTRIKLAPWSQISDWWDSLPPRRRGTPPSFAHYYTDGTVNLVFPGALAAELALDSAGKTYETFSGRSRHGQNGLACLLAGRFGRVPGAVQEATARISAVSGSGRRVTRYARSSSRGRTRCSGATGLQPRRISWRRWIATPGSCRPHGS